MDSYATNNDLSRRFFTPLEEAYPFTDKKYACSELTDLDYVKLGTLRCISHAKTGHQFLQHHADQGFKYLTPDHFFKSLKSERRFENIKSFNHQLDLRMQDLRHDPLAQYEILNGWKFFAVDGHYQKAALFDAKKYSKSSKKMTKIATGHFFRLDLRTHHLGYLELCQTDGDKKKEHDMSVIKRSSADLLRGGALKGQKVLNLWDRACIDYEHWKHLKNSYGIYFATLAKSNSVMEFISEHKLLDTSDPANEGIISDQIVATSKGYRIRKIVYINPEDGVEYIYLTNELTLPPSMIVLLYKHRWDIEKVFDQLKNKMEEKQSWASSPVAKKSHAMFECISHNLMLLLEDGLSKEGLVDEVEPKKQAGRLKGKKISKSFINTALKRATQRTQRFIRWLSSHLYRPIHWTESKARLAKIWGCLT